MLSGELQLTINEIVKISIDIVLKYFIVYKFYFINYPLECLGNNHLPKQPYHL